MFKVGCNFLPCHQWGDVVKSSSQSERRKSFKPQRQVTQRFTSEFANLMGISQLNNSDRTDGKIPNKFGSPLGAIKQTSPRIVPIFQSHDSLRHCKEVQQYVIQVTKTVEKANGNIFNVSQEFVIKHLTGDVAIGYRMVYLPNERVIPTAEERPSSFVYSLKPEDFISRTNIGSRDICGVTYYGSLFPKGLKLYRVMSKGKQETQKELMIRGCLNKGMVEEEAIKWAENNVIAQESIFFPIDSLLKKPLTISDKLTRILEG